MSFNNISKAEHMHNQAYVHRVNTANGWFDRPVSFLEAMMLLTTEVVEVEDAFYEEGLLGGWAAQSHMASEFADCYIRLVDDCSRTLIDLGVQVDIWKNTYTHRKAVSFSGVCMQLIRRIRDAVEAYRVEGLVNEHAGPEVSRHLAFFFLQLQDTCDDYGVNLVQAFTMKMKVNENRPYRHGNKHA